MDTVLAVADMDCDHVVVGDMDFEIVEGNPVRHHMEQLFKLDVRNEQFLIGRPALQKLDKAKHDANQSLKSGEIRRKQAHRERSGISERGF